MQKSTFLINKRFNCSFYQIEIQVITNRVADLKKQQKYLNFRLWQMFYDLFKKAHFRAFFTIFKNHQLHILKSLFVFYSMWTWLTKHITASSAHTLKIFSQDWCALLVLSWNFKGYLNSICYRFSKKNENWRLTIMVNHGKFQCHVADNKAYRATQSLYAMIKAKAAGESCLRDNVVEKWRVQLSQNVWFFYPIAQLQTY